MSFLDWTVLIIVGASFGFAMVKGFARCAISIVAVYLGFIVGAHYFRSFAPVFRVVTSSVAIQDLSGFALIFMIVMIIAAVFIALLRRGLQQAGLDWTDRLAGGALGLVRGWLLASGLYMMLMAFPVQPSLLQNALFAPYLVEGTKVLVWFASPEMTQRVNETHRQLHEFWTRTKGGPPVERNP